MKKVLLFLVLFSSVSFGQKRNMYLDSLFFRTGIGYGLDAYTWFNHTTPTTTESIQDIVGAMVTGNTETNISVTYQDGDGTLDFAGTVGVAAPGAVNRVALWNNASLLTSDNDFTWTGSALTINGNGLFSIGDVTGGDPYWELDGVNDLIYMYSSSIEFEGGTYFIRDGADITGNFKLSIVHGSEATSIDCLMVVQDSLKFRKNETTWWAIPLNVSHYGNN